MPKKVIRYQGEPIEFEKRLTPLGFNRPALDCAMGVITAHLWLQTMTAIDDYLEIDFPILF